MDLLALFSNYDLFFAHAALLFGACFLLLAPLFAPFNAGALKAIALICIAVAAAVIASVPAASGFFSLYDHDALSQIGALIILGCAGFFVLLRRSAFLTGEFLALFLFLLLCLIFMISSDNLVVIFAALEGSSLALYALIAHERRAVNAALGYFNYGMLGSGFFVMAAALYYFQSGSLFLSAGDDMPIAAAVMFTLVIAYKLSVAPLHVWLHEVYARANGAIAGFVSVVPKVAMGVFAYKLCAISPMLCLITLALASCAMLYSAVRSLSATNARSLLVYSSVSHSSFALASAALVAPGQMLYYFAVFGAVNMALFALLEAAGNTSYAALAGRFGRQPFYATLAALLLLNLAALPPFGVFFAKVSVISAALSAYAPAAIFMALASLIMLLAYLRLLVAFFAKPPCGQSAVTGKISSQPPCGQSAVTGNFSSSANSAHTATPAADAHTAHTADAAADDAADAADDDTARAQEFWQFDASAKVALAIAAALCFIAAAFSEAIFSLL